MLINDIDKLNIAIEETESESEFITVVLTNAFNSEEVGRLRILKRRYSTFLLAMGTFIRENYNVFEPRERSLAKLENRESGTIEFVEE